MVLTLSLSRSAWLRAVMEIGTACCVFLALAGGDHDLFQAADLGLGRGPAVSGVASACAQAGPAPTGASALVARRARAKSFAA